MSNENGKDQRIQQQQNHTEVAICVVILLDERFQVFKQKLPRFFNAAPVSETIFFSHEIMYKRPETFLFIKVISLNCYC